MNPEYLTSVLIAIELHSICVSMLTIKCLLFPIAIRPFYNPANQECFTLLAGTHFPHSCKFVLKDVIYLFPALMYIYNSI